MIAHWAVENTLTGPLGLDTTGGYIINTSRSTKKLQWCDEKSGIWARGYSLQIDTY